jgi:hypothetical protein
MNRRAFTALAAFTAVAATVPRRDAWAKAKAPATWDDLVKVKSKRLDAVYLLPGADFRGYSKVQLDPTEVAFRKGWLRDYNESAISLSGRISDSDAQKMADQARTGFEEIFAKAYAQAGYPVVTAPGPDVLRVRTAVANLSIDAPELDTIGRTRTYSVQAGEATLVLEARDSATGALLGRAVDQRLAGDMTVGQRNSITNRADFAQLFETWAKLSVDGLGELKALSPIGPNGELAKR